MLDRRTLFSSLTGFTTAIGSIFGSREAIAAKPSFKGDLDPRGTVGRLERLPTLDLESQQDFLTGFRKDMGRAFRRVGSQRMAALFEAKGLDAFSDPSIETILEIAENDHILGMHVRTWVSMQQFTWSTIQEVLYRDPEKYLAELEAADNAGPGTLELNPDMDLPDHVKHEIHIMPGGFVGDPLGGYVYHYGTNNFSIGRNNQDEISIGFANATPVPSTPTPNGRPLRILEVGCTIGRITIALKERFPDAEVWGIDAGGPMVRYAHMRAVDLGVDVNFAQRLAEDTKFEDGYFDVVMSYILHHEMPAEISNQTVNEIHRILRPGGIYFPIDFYTGENKPSPNASQKYRHWWDHRWNNEVWWEEYTDLDLFGAMQKAGFEASEDGPAAWIGRKNLVGTKPV
ncbi:MAG: class I SAM-dependent methyltransferase [Rhodospirillaceae bacterium]|nr:class I SAM-dependent methyltransferase [Rhodospirillaceae bacterium]